MNWWKCSISILVLLMISACQSSSKTDQDQLLKLIKTESKIRLNSQEIAYVMVIPRKGCSGCIGLADMFFKQHAHRMDTYYVFTKVSSVKTLKIRLGSDLLEQENVLLDVDGKFSKENWANIYPVVAVFKNGELIDYQEVSPSNKDYITRLQQELALSITHKSFIN